MFGFVMFGLVMFGLVMLGFVTSAFVMFGFVMLGFVMFGFVMLGLVMSGFKTAVEVRPFVTVDPPIVEICVTFTVMLAAAFVEVANTLRDTDEYGGIVTSSVVNVENCRKDAVPPVGWFAMENRTFSGALVVFCASTGNARWKGTVFPLKVVVPSGFAFPGAAATSPPVICEV